MSKATKRASKQHPSLESRVLRTIREFRLLDAGDRVLVAVSGGADSAALLFLLLALGKELSVELMAGHFEHGIRGEASQSDAAFVMSLCDGAGIRCFMGQGDAPALSMEQKMSLEDAARKARYDFLYRTASEQKVNKIALGHHMRDQAETLLLHLTHGCGLTGLSGMRYVNGKLIRPLLSILPEELKEYLRGKGIEWREDETNDDLHYSRNLLRHKALPILEQLNPRVVEAMARTSFQAAKAQDALNEIASASLRGRVKRMPYGAFWLIGDKTPEGNATPEGGLKPENGITPTIDACRLFASWAGVPPLDAALSEALFNLSVSRASSVCNLPSGWRAMRTKERLHLLSPERFPGAEPKGVSASESKDLSESEAKDGFLPVRDAILFKDASLSQDDFRIEAYDSSDSYVSGGYGDGIHTQVLDANKIGGAVFRYRQKGDVFSPIGQPGTQKLKKTLQDAGIDRPFRDLLPILARGSRVLWIVGLKPSGDAAVTGETQKKVKITYQDQLPWEM